MKNEEKEESEGERGEESAAGQWSTCAVMMVTVVTGWFVIVCDFSSVFLLNLNPEESFDMGHGEGQDFRRSAELELVEANITTAAAVALASAATKAKVNDKTFE